MKAMNIVSPFDGSVSAMVFTEDDILSINIFDSKSGNDLCKAKINTRNNEIISITNTDGTFKCVDKMDSGGITMRVVFMFYYIFMTADRQLTESGSINENDIMFNGDIISKTEYVGPM